jgi:hypothetical protein
MTLANDSIVITPGSGATVATHLIGGKEHQAVVLADSDGQIHGSLATYMYATPTVAVGASKLYFDIFNATGSGKVIDVRGIWVIPATDVAVTGLLGARYDLYRTSAIGTGGTAAVYKSATPDVAGGNINPFDTNNADLPAGVTARWLPTGGATIAQWLFGTYAPGEETPTSMSFYTQFQNIIPVFTVGQKLTIRENSGILVKQGTVASAGNTKFLVAFTAE